ncbi:MAG: NTP transferase domain-containing protein [Deltaproteobacteria bacterium]|nr:NTP transferase domain-containing protein [Deltaproteobacteria bacterium]
MYAVIMAGGSGTRFWPVSRKSRPKQFLNIIGKDPMVVETCNRLKPLSGDEEMILVLGEEHLREARDLFGDRALHMLAEPMGRNTAPAIGVGAMYARHLGCHDPVAFLPADHYIGDPSAFIESLRRAGERARSGGIVTLGIVPVRPETGYGYIRRDRNPIGPGEGSAYRVLEFVEKPDVEKALQYLAGGEYYWNAGIFVATPETILKETKALLPDLYDGLVHLTDALGKPEFDAVFREVYERLAPISFDYGIMEKTKEEVYVLPCQCGWSDVGSWASLYELRSAERDANQNLTDGDTLLIDCEQSFVSGRGARLVACLGLENCLVVDTPETLLVAPMDRSQDIRKIVAQLKKKGKDNLL